MNPHMLALDLDGTLLASKRGISLAHRQFVSDVRAAGIEVVIVTGRPWLTARAVWEDLGLDSWMVCFNGVWVVDPQGVLVHDASLSGDQARTVIDTIADEAGTLSVYPHGKKWRVDGFTDHTAGWQQGYGVAIEVDTGLRSQWHAETPKIMFTHFPEVMHSLASRLLSELGDEFHVVLSESDRVEIHAKYATKAWGLSQVATSLGIAQSNIWAAGDGDNDIEMLHWAGRSFAMGQATKRAKAAASDLLPSVDADGLVAIRECLKLE